MLRSAAALIVGYLLAIVPSMLAVGALYGAGRTPGRLPAALAVFLLLITGGLSGMVAARIAARRPMLHAAVLAAMVLGVVFLSLARGIGIEPAGFTAASSAALVLGVLAGGRVASA